MIAALFTEPGPLQDAVAQGVPWEGRLSHRPAPEGPALWFAVQLRPASAEGVSGLLLTMSDATAAVEAERLQQIAAEGENARAAVASHVHRHGPISDRLSAALVPVSHLDGANGALRSI